MKLFALYICAFLYEPGPNDALRFGMPIVSTYPQGGQPSPARAAWRQSTYYRAYIVNLQRTWAIPGQEDALAALLEDAAWSERAWDQLDNMANSWMSQSGRIQSAYRLRDIIGPVNYYLGRMPAPWPWTLEE